MAPEAAIRMDKSAALDERSIHLRRLVIDALEGGSRGHIGSTMSLMEILRVLYDDILKYDPQIPDWELRDRCILSKGHGCLALYSVLADKGFFPEQTLKTFCHSDSIIGGHPEYGKVPGVEFSTGALGHGFPVAVGMALATRMKGRDARVFVVMGDGEINEGSVWEAALSAGKHGLDDLTALIDYNKLQSYGSVDYVQPLEPLADKWRSFGFGTCELDGHDVEALKGALSALPIEPGKPSLVICHTVKGRGIAHAEGRTEWHHKSRLGADEITAMREAVERG